MARSIHKSGNASQKLTACGNLNTPGKVRQLMRKIINYQLLKLITPAQQNSINGSCNVILKAFEFEAFEDRIMELEERFRAKQKRDKKKGGKKGKYDQAAGQPIPSPAGPAVEVLTLAEKKGKKTVIHNRASGKFIPPPVKAGLNPSETTKADRLLMKSGKKKSGKKSSKKSGD